jgi:hypothetical protein
MRTREEKGLNLDWVGSVCALVVETGEVLLMTPLLSQNIPQIASIVRR